VFGAGGGNEFAANDAGQRRTILGRGPRRGQAQPISARQQLAIPAAPYDRKSVTHQESMPEVVGRERIVVARAVVEESQSQFVAAVVDVVQQRAIAFLGLHRSENEQVGEEVDASVGLRRRAIQVDDQGVGRRLRVQCIVHAAHDPFVRTGLAERLAFSDQLPLKNFKRN
jgi:hypothetical protein